MLALPTRQSGWCLPNNNEGTAEGADEEAFVVEAGAVLVAVACESGLKLGQERDGNRSTNHGISVTQ
jgi:hypothetical protein